MFYKFTGGANTILYFSSKERARNIFFGTAQYRVMAQSKKLFLSLPSGICRSSSHKPIINRRLTFPNQAKKKKG